MLRVLIGQISKENVFAASGRDLFVGSDDRNLNSNIACEFQAGDLSSLIWKNPFLENQKWHCKFGDQLITLEKNIYLHSLGEIITTGKHSYRGHIELLATKDALYVINHVPADAYLASLVNSEMSPSFPPAALKAQIIAARSYAMATTEDRRKKMWPFDLYSSQSDQVYKGSHFESPQSWSLVKSSGQKVLKFRNNVLKAFYHSSSGGQLEAPLNVWGGDHVGEAGAYQARPNPYDRDLKSDGWSATLGADAGAQMASTGNISEIKVLQRTEGQRVKKISVKGSRGTTQFSGTQFRSLFGTGLIRSTLFEVKKQGSSFVIKGRGWGHGVGMSQWGAKAMADSGKSAEQILKFYYPGAHVADLGTPASSNRIFDSRPTGPTAAR